MVQAPGLKSMGNFFCCYLKSAIVENAPLGWSTKCAFTLLITHRTCSSTQICQILKIKGLQCKIISLCRLHKYKNVIMDSHCVYQNLPTYLLAHEQIRLLSGDVFSLCALKSRRLNRNPPWRERNSLLKGMGDETLIGLLHVMPQNTPITH